MSNQNNGSFSDIRTPVTAVHNNLDQEIIQITEDKLRLALTTHLSKIEEKKDWMTPLSVFLSMVAVFCTASFKDAFWLSASSWAAVFFISGIISFGLFCKTAYRSYNAPSMDDIISKIKNTSSSSP